MVEAASIAIFGVHIFFITIKLSNKNTQNIVNAEYKMKYKSTATVWAQYDFLLKSSRRATRIESPKMDSEK